MSTLLLTIGFERNSNVGILMSMSKRLQIVVSDAEAEEVRQAAIRSGLTLSEWARQAMRHVRERDIGTAPEQKLSALDRALAGGARALVLTPRAQNPTGAALDAARVRELRQVLARRPQVLLIEDDHAAAASGATARTLCRDREHYAIVRSVSKTLGPDLRLAFLAGDTRTVARVEGRQVLGTRWVSHILQQLVLRLLRDPATPKHLERAAERITLRREALVGALAERGVQARGRSGMNVWVPVPEETAVVQRLAAAGFAVSAGEVFRMQTPPAIRITTAALPTGQVPSLAAALAAALQLGRRGSAA